MDLRPYQFYKGVQRILELRKCALHWSPGAGKTATVISAIDALMMAGDVTRALVVSPKRVAWSVWPAEVEKWAPHLTCVLAAGDTKLKKGAYTKARLRDALSTEGDIYSTDYETLEKLMKHFGRKWPFDMLVIDEASMVKTHSSKRSRLLRRVAKHTRYVVELTGTPASNGIPDLWHQILLLDEGERLEPTLGAFRDKWCVQIPPNEYNTWGVLGSISKRDRKKRDPQWVADQDALRLKTEAAITDRIKDIAFSLHAEDYIDLPPITHNNILVDLPPAVKTEYDEFREEFVLNFGDDDVASSPNAAAAAAKLLQIANGAVYIDDTETEWRELHTAKLDALSDLVAEAAGEPMLVFYTFISDRERILARFKHARHIDGVDLDGWNRGEVPMLLAHPFGAAHGLNLQAGGRIVVWFGPTWNLEWKQQADKRLHRSGQQHHVFVHHILGRGTLDVDVMNRLADKADVQDRLLEELKR